MFRGNYSGYQGSALDTDDAFLVSRTMLLMLTLTLWTRVPEGGVEDDDDDDGGGVVVVVVVVVDYLWRPTL